MLYLPNPLLLPLNAQSRKCFHAILEKLFFFFTRTLGRKKDLSVLPKDRRVSGQNRGMDRLTNAPVHSVAQHLHFGCVGASAFVGFLDASSHLYERACLLVCPSVGPLVRNALVKINEKWTFTDLK